MADWVLIPCLKELFAEFDRIAPSRDHASDGSIGDTAHQQESSDHNPDETGNVPIHDADHTNEVHAIDVDNNLNRADLGSDPMETVIQFLLAECRKNNPNGTDRGRLRYMIYNRRIWKASNGWKQEAYTGSSPHTEHAHFSAEYDTSYESDTSPWGLVEKFGDDMPSAEEIANAVWNKFYTQTPLSGPDGKPDGTYRTPAGEKGWNQGVPSQKAGKRVNAYQLLGTVETQILLANQTLAELAGKDFTDEAAIVSGVLAGLAESQGAQAVADAVLAGLPPDLAQQVVDEMGARLSAPQA